MHPNLTGWQKSILRANLVSQTGIVVTGALVRVTASGLGCPTWPECVAGSITPTSTQTQSWHKYVEFGNRLLTGAISLVAVATLITVFVINRNRVTAGLSKRSGLTKLALAVVAGIFAQAILGGITVLTGLNPLTVAAHFLVSMGLIAISVLLVIRAQEPETTSDSLPLAKPVRYLVQAIAALALLIITLGTLVTGTGPHAGDTAKVTRLKLDAVTITHVHATAVQLFFGLVIGLIVAILANTTPQPFLKRTLIVLAVSLGQGLIGYIQYFTGLPWALVALHVLGACLLWISTLYLLALTLRPTVKVATSTDVE